jgi:hypothetical protein
MWIGPHHSCTPQPSHPCIPDDRPKDLTPRALVDHPDPEISALANEYLDLGFELVSSALA